MLSKSNLPPVTALKVLTSAGIPCALIVPTPTGLRKSILDATEQVRAFLLNQKLHDYASQPQGKGSKVYIPAFIPISGRTIATRISLYRPPTKSGDPRLWVARLGSYVRAYDLLALTTDGQSITLLNMSDPQVYESISRRTGHAWTLVSGQHQEMSPEAVELLEKLRAVCSLGYIASAVAGDTGVGMTLERALGIPVSARRITDYKGIEIKAGRRRGRSAKATMFGQAPNWKRSRMQTKLALLSAHGYVRDGRKQLYCTVSNKPNPQGLYLEINDKDGTLRNKHRSGNEAPTDVVLWEMSSLREQLRKKHNETFWVIAEQSVRDGREYFHYVEATYTRGPLLDNLGILISDGKFTLDFALHLEGTRVRDHSYLFRLAAKHRGLLFPPSQDFILCDR